MKEESNIKDQAWEELLKAYGAKPMPEEELRHTEILRKKSFEKEKYQKSLRTITRFKMKELRESHPDWHLNEIIAAIFIDYNPEIPPHLLLKMTSFIVEEWEKSMQKKAVPV